MNIVFEHHIYENDSLKLVSKKNNVNVANYLNGWERKSLYNCIILMETIEITI